MSNGKKLFVAFLGCGLTGMFTYGASLYTSIAPALVALAVASTAIMAKLIGWTPTQE